MLKYYRIFCFIFTSLIFISCSDSIKKKEKDTSNNKSEARTIEDVHGNKIECLVDLDNVTRKNTITNAPEFKSVKWDDETKEAWIELVNGDSLYVHVTGCRDFYVQARLKRFNSTEKFEDSEHWFNEAMWIAKHVRGFDPEHLDEIHETKKYTSEQDEDGVSMDFNEHDYDLYVDRSGLGTLIMLVHHFQ